MKSVKWKILMAKLLTWMALELLLNFLGLDLLANYGEFLFPTDRMVVMS